MDVEARFAEFWGQRADRFAADALSLRNDAASLEKFLTDRFHLSSFNELMRNHVVAGLRDCVSAHDPAQPGTLKGACWWVLQIRVREGVELGYAPPEWANIPRVPSDFEPRALSLRHSESQLRTYLAEAFGNWLRLIPPPAADHILDGLQAAVTEFRGEDHKALFEQCFSVLVERFPMDNAEVVSCHQRIEF